MAPAVVIALAALATGAIGGWLTCDWRAQARIGALQLAHDQKLRAAADAALREQTARILLIQKVNDAETIRSADRAAHRRAAAVAGDGLRIRADTRAADAAAAAAAGECQATAAIARMLADVLGRVEEAGRLMAATADERGDAGITCEQWADAVTRVAQ